MSQTKGIGRKVGPNGSRAVIEGTRIRVQDVAQMYQLELDEIIISRLLEAWPHLTAGQIQTAIEYWRENPAEIEADIKKDEEIFARLSAAQ